MWKEDGLIMDFCTTTEKSLPRPDQCSLSSISASVNTNSKGEEGVRETPNPIKRGIFPPNFKFLTAG